MDSMDPDAADAVLEPTKWELAFSPFDVPPPKDRLHAYQWQLATDKQAKKLSVLWQKAVQAAGLPADRSASACDLNLNFFLSVGQFGQGRYSTMSYKIYRAQLLGSCLTQISRLFVICRHCDEKLNDPDEPSRS